MKEPLHDFQYPAGVERPAYTDAIIERPQLYARLDSWPGVRAVVIHAPAGYGKSSLVSRWLDQRRPQARSAWLALGADDNDPRFFVTHLATVLDQVIPAIATLLQPILHDGYDPATRAMQRLCLALEEHSNSEAQPVLLIFDDLHIIEASTVHKLIATLLEQAPATFHYILLARRRTGLPLARLYAHGKVTALDTEDLRFTPKEVAAYLQRRGFPPPTEAEVVELTLHSEGWVTALQLAVLALREHTSVHDLLAMLHGANTWLADFLADEVLDHQPPELRTFLLQTALLDSFNAELCAAVTGMDDAYGKLAAIARADLFLLPLDGKGWYRYHQLFQELLQHRLRAQSPARLIAELHRRAAAWLAGVGSLNAAVRHLLAAGDLIQAADLVEADLRTTLLRDPYRARSLLTLLPDELLRQRPQLMLDRCRLALLSDDRQIHTYLQEATHTMQLQANSDTYASRHHAEWLVLQAGGAFMLGDPAKVADAIRSAELQLTFLDDFHIGIIHFLQMHLHRAAEHRTTMLVAAEAALAAFERAAWGTGIVALQRELARWSMISGDSKEASRRFHLIAADNKRDRAMVATELIIAYYLAAEQSYWLDHLAQARQYQQLCMERALQLQDQELITMAQCLGELLEPDRASLDVAAFANYLGQVRSRAIFDYTLDAKTRSLIAARQYETVWQLLEVIKHTLLQADTRSLRRQRIITYLRAAIACGNDPAAITPMLNETLATAAAGGERLYQLQLLALQAWQQWQLHDMTAASATLRDAAQLAQATGYVRVLLDIPDLAGPLAALSISLVAVQGEPVLRRSAALTAQEQRVLKLLAANYSYAQIGAALVLSIGTVRTHVRHLYDKLGVHRREEAISVARQRGWLG